jgi:hypothetical protein
MTISTTPNPQQDLGKTCLQIVSEAFKEETKTWEFEVSVALLPSKDADREDEKKIIKEMDTLKTINVFVKDLKSTETSIEDVKLKSERRSVPV